MQCLGNLPCFVLDVTEMLEAIVPNTTLHHYSVTKRSGVLMFSDLNTVTLKVEF